MTLEGWTIAKQMSAGLIPGVNIFSRPRVFRIYTMMSVQEAQAAAFAAIAAHNNMDPSKAMEAFLDKAVPPLSPERKREQETGAAIDLLKRMAPKG
jgi:hypothetical protein